mmetsp:Transcript_20604/g.57309  ORF Transcript_20604/g.57309 Transcript_20604/m.57309 type:complete len:325 (-) Transcript_20604:1937-2911(-)
MRALASAACPLQTSFSNCMSSSSSDRSTTPRSGLSAILRGLLPSLAGLSSSSLMLRAGLSATLFTPWLRSPSSLDEPSSTAVPSPFRLLVCSSEDELEDEPTRTSSAGCVPSGLQPQLLQCLRLGLFISSQRLHCQADSLRCLCATASAAPPPAASAPAVALPPAPAATAPAAAAQSPRAGAVDGVEAVVAMPAASSTPGDVAVAAVVVVARPLPLRDTGNGAAGEALGDAEPFATSSVMPVAVALRPRPRGGDVATATSSSSSASSGTLWMGLGPSGKLLAGLSLETSRTTGARRRRRLFRARPPVAAASALLLRPPAVTLSP